MKQFAIKLAKYLMIPVGALWKLIRPASHVSILLYHRVNDGVNKEISVRTADFRWQMEYLKRHGYRVVTLDEAVAGLPEGGKRVVITFDDGYEDFCLNAYPVLREYGYACTVYLVPGYVGTGKVFRWDGDIGESRLMSWEQISALKEDGLVVFGSHTMSHSDLDSLSRAGTVRELRESREALRTRLSSDVRHFAYPRGIVTPDALAAARELYATAVSIFDGYEIIPEGIKQGTSKLKRLPVQRSDGRHLFRARLNGWLAPEGWLKLALGRH